MKILSLLLAFVTVLSCSHFQNNRTPSNSASALKPRHLVITVHGLSGNSETFGYFGEATKKYLSTLTPSYEVETMNFLYPTGRSEKKGAYDFAMGSEGLGEFIKKQFQNRPLTAQDKISLVSHSQGGLISYMWFFNTITSQNADFEYAKHIDSIITLGTPFWGSKISSILTDDRNVDIIPLIKLFAPDSFRMTRREIADIAYGSDTVNAFRTMAIRLDNDPSIAQEIEKLPVRLINITGVLPSNKDDLFSSASHQGNLVSKTTKKIINFVYSIFTKSYSGNKRVESDIAVPVPSSRWNFIYTTPKNITQDTVINSTDYKDFSHLVARSKFLFTESSHLPFDNENTLSMAYVNKSCLEVETCTHPTYRYIIEHLANCKLNAECNQDQFQNIIERMKAVNLDEHKSFKEIKDSLESFAIQINIRMKPGQIDQFPVQYFTRRQMGYEYPGYEKWEFKQYSLIGKVIDLKNNKSGESSASTANYKIYVADPDEKHSIDVVSKQATQDDPFDYLRINITGRIEDVKKTTATPYVVPIELKLPGLPNVKINALVQPSYSTFTMLDFTQ